MNVEQKEFCYNLLALDSSLEHVVTWLQVKSSPPDLQFDPRREDGTAICWAGKSISVLIIVKCDEGNVIMSISIIVSM